MKKQLLPIGLDWGATGLRAVQLYRRGREIGLFSALETSFPPAQDAPMDVSATSAAQDPNLDDHNENVKHLLASLHKDGGFSGTSIMIHCPADRLDLRPITLPGDAEKLPHDAVIQSIRLQMKPHIRFDINEAIIDYYLLPAANRAAGTKLITVTADGGWIRRRVSLLQSWGWQCRSVIPLPAALSRLAKTMPPTDAADHDDAATLLKPILCIGHRHMVLTVHLHEGPVFSRVFDFGGEIMADALALRLQVNFTQAHRLIHAYGLSGSENSFTALAENNAATATADAVDPAVHHLRQEIARAVRTALREEVSLLAEGLTRALNYVINEYSQAKLDRVRCCGGGAHTPGLTRELSDQLEWPVDIIDHPLLDEICSQWPEGRAPAGQWATALALAYPQEGESA